MSRDRVDRAVACAYSRPWTCEQRTAFWQRYAVTNIRVAGTLFRSSYITITARYGGVGGSDVPRDAAILCTTLTTRESPTGRVHQFRASDVRIDIPVFTAWSETAINMLGNAGASANVYDWPVILEAVDLMRGVHGPVPVCWEAGMPMPPGWTEPNARLPFPNSQRSDWRNPSNEA